MTEVIKVLRECHGPSWKGKSHGSAGNFRLGILFAPNSQTEKQKSDKQLMQDEDKQKNRC